MDAFVPVLLPLSWRNPQRKESAQGHIKQSCSIVDFKINRSLFQNHPHENVTSFFPATHYAKILILLEDSHSLVCHSLRMSLYENMLTSHKL